MRDERGVSLSVWTAVAMPAFIVAVGLGVDFSGHAAAEQEAREVRQAAAAAQAAVAQAAAAPAERPTATPAPWAPVWRPVPAPRGPDSTGMTARHSPG